MTLYIFSLCATQPSRPRDAKECSMLKNGGEEPLVEAVV